jgi:hypothetical protein
LKGRKVRDRKVTAAPTEDAEFFPAFRKILEQAPSGTSIRWAHGLKGRGIGRISATIPSTTDPALLKRWSIDLRKFLGSTQAPISSHQTHTITLDFRIPRCQFTRLPGIKAAVLEFASQHNAP